MSFAVTLTLVLVTIVVLPMATMLVGAWLIVSAYDENSALRRGIARIGARWIARVAVADVDREYAKLTCSNRPAAH